MTNEEKKNETKEEQIEELVVWNVNFKMPITLDEANEVVNNRKGEIARKLKKYTLAVLKRACEKIVDANKRKDKEIKNCKISK